MRIPALFPLGVYTKMKSPKVIFEGIKLETNEKGKVSPYESSSVMHEKLK